MRKEHHNLAILISTILLVLTALLFIAVLAYNFGVSIIGILELLAVLAAISIFVFYIFKRNDLMS